jgi:hypothetical protein
MHHSKNSCGRKHLTSNVVDRFNLQTDLLNKKPFGYFRPSMPRSLADFIVGSDPKLTFYAPTRLFLGDEIIRLLFYTFYTFLIFLFSY